MGTPEYKIIRTFLSRRPGRFSAAMALGTVLACAAVSHIYWLDQEWSARLAATPNSVFGDGQFWRLISTTFVHGDLEHLLSNSYMLAILVFFVFGHFGGWIFPVSSLLGATVVNALSLSTYPTDVRLVGASGLVYFLAGFWLTMFIAIERQRDFWRRCLRAIGVGLMILFPSTFEPHVSYRTHAIGFLVGVAFALIYFNLNRMKIRDAEVLVALEDADAPNPPTQ
jgi:rhomboid protease GluP